VYVGLRDPELTDGTDPGCRPGRRPSNPNAASSRCDAKSLVAMVARVAVDYLCGSAPDSVVFLDLFQFVFLIHVLQKFVNLVDDGNFRM
jgi:hypothetical protein